MQLISRFSNLAISMARQRARTARPGATAYTGPGVILAYAGVTNAQAARFRTQMEWLAGNAIVQPLAELVAVGGAMSDRPRVGITFDGAFDSVYRNAIPVLDELGLAATVFPVSGSLGRAPNWDLPRNDPAGHEIIMTVGQLASLNRDLFEIGSQTATHPHLDHLAPERIRAELLNSMNDLQAFLARPVETLSVPFGAWNALVVSAAREVGYEVVVTRDAHLLASGSQPVVVGRTVASPEDWDREFELKVMGGYGWRTRRRVDDRAHVSPNQPDLPMAHRHAESTPA